MANIIESFDGTNGSAPNGVRTPNGGVVDIQSNQLRIMSANDGGGAQSFWTRPGLANGDLRVSVGAASLDPQTFDIIIRSSTTGSFTNCYVARIDVSSSRLDLIGYTAGVEDEMAMSPFTWVPGVRYFVRFHFEGPLLQLKAWRTTDAEPGAWNVEWTDAAHTAAGNLGLAVRAWGGERTALWDNLQVLDLDNAGGGTGLEWASKGDTLGGAESGALAIPVPESVGPGDLVIVDIYKENNREVTNSSGFQPVGSPTASGGGEFHHQFWKRSSGVEPSTAYSFAYSTTGLTGPQTWRSGVANRIVGADPLGNPIEAIAVAADAGNDTVSPSVQLETLGPNRLLFWSATVSDYASLDEVPPGFTERVDDGYHIAAATKLQSAAGQTGAVVGEFSVSSPRTARLLAIRPASTGPAADPPTVDAGADGAIDLGATFTRTATVDDGGAAITTMSWKVQSGPLLVGNTLSTTAALTFTPTVVGTYVLRFTATNSAGTVNDDITIVVSTPPPPPALEEPPATFQLEPKTWYAGPLGNLRKLDTPETVSPTQIKYSGGHRGLSGAFVEDFTGVKSTYDIQFNYLDSVDYHWLNSMNTQHLPAPYFLRDPLLKNRLSTATSRLTAGVLTNPGIQTYGTLTWSRDVPAEASVAGKSVKIDQWPSHPLIVRFDGARPVPAFPGEPVTGSVYVKSGPGESMEGVFLFEYFDADGEYLGRSESVDFEIPEDDWERISCTYVTPLGVAAMRMRLDAGATDIEGDPASDGPLYLCAPQLEAGPTATAWEIGGGLPQVSISDFQAESPRYPLWNVSLTFTEA